MTQRILFDTDFIVALFIPNQSTHNRAKDAFMQIKDSEHFIVDITLFELATVLSVKFSHKDATTIVKDLLGTAITKISAVEFEEVIWKEFFAQKRNNISFVDCANLVVAKEYGFKIASFDAFYPKPLVSC